MILFSLDAYRSRGLELASGIGAMHRAVSHKLRHPQHECPLVWWPPER